MKKQNQYFVEEREIDIKRMAFHALSYWRFILAVAVIGAVFMGVVQYRADVRMAEASIQAQIDAANAPEITVEYLKSQMTPEMVRSVQNAIQYREASEQRQEYMDTSIYMNIDAYDENVVYLTYSVQGAGAAGAIGQIHLFVQSTDMAEAVAKDLEMSLENQYIAELYSVSASDNASYFTMQVIGDTEEFCEAFADSVTRVLGSYVREILEGNPELAISEAGRVSDVVVDNTLIALRRGYTAEIYNDINFYNGYYGGFGDLQRQLLEMMLEERKHPEGSEDGGAAEKAPVDITSIDTSIHVMPSIRMIAAGFFAGAVIGFALRALLYTISKCIHGEDEVKYLFGIPVFGVVNTRSLGKRRFFSAVDDVIDRISSGRHKYLNYEQQMQMVYSNIVISCKNKKITRVYLSGSEIGQVPQECLRALRELLAKAGIESVYGGGIAYDAEAVVQMAETGACVLVEVSEKTKCEEIAKELNLCSQNQVEVLGMMLAYKTPMQPYIPRNA